MPPVELRPRAARLLPAVRGAICQVHVQPPVAGFHVYRLRLLRALQVDKSTTNVQGCRTVHFDCGMLLLGLKWAMVDLPQRPPVAG